MSISLASDAIWEAVASYVNAQLGLTLGLKTCEQGNYLQLPSSDDLSDILPMVVVDWTEASGKKLPEVVGVELVHTVTIHYVQVLADADVASREVQTAITQIAQLFAQPPWESLPGYTPSAGLNIFDRSAPTMRILDTFTGLDLPIGHGSVDLTVTVHYYDA